MTQKNKDTELTIGTYSRILMSDFTTLANIVVKNTAFSSNFLEAESKLPDILSKEQIFDALHGPYAPFFQQKFQAYALLAKAQSALHHLKDESFKDLPQKITEDKISYQDMQSTLNKLNELTTEHYQQWEQLVSQASALILEHLQEENIEFNELESEEFLTNETFSQIIKRCTDLNIEIPEKNSPLDLATYLRLKTHIALQNSLSRQHKPHGTAEIKNELKKIKSAFSEINEAEDNLTKEHENDTNELMSHFKKFFPNEDNLRNS